MLVGFVSGTSKNIYDRPIICLLHVHEFQTWDNWCYYQKGCLLSIEEGHFNNEKKLK